MLWYFFEAQTLTPISDVQPGIFPFTNLRLGPRPCKSALPPDLEKPILVPHHPI
jgi:hypothetical protein